MENLSHCTTGGRDPRRKGRRRSLLSRVGTFLVVLVIVSLMLTGEHWLLLEAPTSAAAVPTMLHAASSG